MRLGDGGQRLGGLAPGQLRRPERFGRGLTSLMNQIATEDACMDEFFRGRGRLPSST